MIGAGTGAWLKKLQLKKIGDNKQELHMERSYLGLGLSALSCSTLDYNGCSRVFRGLLFVISLGVRGKVCKELITQITSQIRGPLKFSGTRALQVLEQERQAIWCRECLEETGFPQSICKGLLGSVPPMPSGSCFDCARDRVGRNCADQIEPMK